MRTPAQADLQRWSDEVARDPRSLAFLPLARAYRRQGLHDTAMQLCLRGLDAHPANVEAHGLLALLYVERGDHERAADEWSIVRRVDPDNFEALRGLGFCYLQQDRLSRARQMLERAALLRPQDPTVQEALRMLGAHAEAPARPAADMAAAEPWADTPVGPVHGVTSTEDTGDAEEPQTREPVGTADRAAADPTPARSGRAYWHGDTPFEPEPDTVEVEPAGARPHADDPSLADAPAAHADASAYGESGAFAYSTLSDPAWLFEDLLGSGPVLGALVVDAQGLVLAGRISQESTDAAVLGAVLGGAAMEAARTAAHLALGEWRGIMMEAEDALLHLVPAGRGAMVVLAARRGTPAGWMRRAAAQAADRAQLYLEAYG